MSHLALVGSGGATSPGNGNGSPGDRNGPPGRGGGSSGRIVVDTADTPATPSALRWALRHAQLHGGEIELVSVVRPHLVPLEPASIGWAVGVGPDVLASVRAWQDRLVFEILGAQATEFVVGAHVAVGEPVDELVQAAHGAGLLVVGRRARRRWLAWRSTIAERCALRVACAVVEVSWGPDGDGYARGLRGAASGPRGAVRAAASRTTSSRRAHH